MARIPSKKEYLRAVAQKLNNPTTRRLLQFGQTWNKNATPVRDRLGMIETQKSILTSAANMYDMTAGRVAFSQQMSNFSAGATYEDVADVRTVGAIDLTILSMSQSLIPFLCIDRGMTATDDTIYYNNLVAVNTAAGVQAGQTVWGNFNPPPSGLDLSGSGTVGETLKATSGTDTAAPTALSLPASVMLNSVKISVVKADETIAMGGIAPDGTAYIVGIGANAPAGITATYNSTNHTITVSATAADADAKITVTYESDPAKTQTDTTGDVLIVEPQWTALPLHSTPHNIILQNNLMNMMYMSKVNALATGTAGNPYTDAIFQRVRNTYIESINGMIIRGMVTSVSSIDVLMDGSNYGITSVGRAATKNDLVCQTVANMKAAMLAKSGCGMTAIVANSVAVAMMETIPVFFVKNPNINAGLNGLVGYFMDIPVYRHNSLDRFTRTYTVNTTQYTGGVMPTGTTPASASGTSYTISGADAVMFGAYRTADNTSGSQVYGEYLPFTNTGNVGNYAMPVQQSSGFFSMVAHKVVDPRLITLAVITGNANMYGWAKVDPVPASGLNG